MIKWFKKFYKPYKTPRFIQMEGTECGAATLGMILGYYGKYVSLEELRKTCGVSRDGVNMEDMNLAAQHYGLDVGIFEVPFEELITVSLPSILYWDFNHFVVLEEMTGEKVWINDPAMGHRTISMQELSRSYSGLVMECKPGKFFQASGRRDSFFQRIKTKIVPFEQSLRFLLFIQLALVILGLTIPVFAQIFIDQFFGTLLPTWEWKFLLLFLGIVFFTGLMNWTQKIFLNFLQAHIAIQLSTHFLWKIFRLPILFFKQRFGSELVNRLRLNNRIGEILTTNVILNTLNLLLLSSYWVVMLFYNLSITFIAAGIALYNLSLIWYIGKIRSNAYAKLQQSEAKTVGISFDALKHIETMKGNANEQFFFSRLSKVYTENINNVQEIQKKDIWLSMLSKFSEQLSTVIILGIGSFAIMKGELTVGKLIALQILYRNFLAPVGQLVNFSTEIQSVEVDLTRLDDVEKAEIDPFLNPRKPSAIQIPPKGEIEFKKVDFGYKLLQPPFIKNLNLHIHKGEMIGLTGPIASGKSTIAKLACCLFQPKKGKVQFDGKSYEEYTRESLSGSIGIVDQIVQLFPGTIRENLLLWNPSEILEEEVIKAAETACLHEEIMDFPERYSTLLQEEGKNLSAGQRQRLEIARVLLKKPSFIVLDEATNSIDSETEAKILSNIRALKITTVLISHRLSTFKNCDRIFVLDKGKIIQEGTHEALSKTTGLYQRLLEFEIQKKI